MKLDCSHYLYLSCNKTDLKALILSSNELTVLPGLGSLEQLNTLGDHHQLYPVYWCIFCVCTCYANTSHVVGKILSDLGAFENTAL